MLVPKGDGASKVTKGMYQFGVKKALTCLRLLFLMTRYRNLKLLCRGGVQRVFRGCLEKIYPFSGGCLEADYVASILVKQCYGDPSRRGRSIEVEISNNYHNCFEDL